MLSGAQSYPSSAACSPRVLRHDAGGAVFTDRAPHASRPGAFGARVWSFPEITRLRAMGLSPPRTRARPDATTSPRPRRAANSLPDYRRRRGRALISARAHHIPFGTARQRLPIFSDCRVSRRLQSTPSRFELLVVHHLHRLPSRSSSESMRPKAAVNK